MPFKINAARFYLCFFILMPIIARGQNAHITVNASHVLNRIPANLYGACIEDVNHEIYGGLYDQRIFGESFEEPAPSPVIKGWKSFSGNWQVDKNTVGVNAGEGFKLIRQALPGKLYTAEVLMKFGKQNDNAGVLINVSNAKNGADSFTGYEISIDPHKKVLVFGKHQNNWIPIQEIKLNIDFDNWIKLSVENRGNSFAVYLNNNKNPVAVLVDANNPLPAGAFGLRTYNADVEFKDLIFSISGKTIPERFISKAAVQVSEMWVPVNSSGAGTFMLDSTNAYNGRQSQVMVHNGAKGIVGIANKGLNGWGIALRRNNTYSGSIFMKGLQLNTGVTISLQSADGKITYGSRQIKNISNVWKPYQFSLKASQTDARARFVISIDSKGTLSADQVTLMCKQEQFKGLPLRADIAMAMQHEGLNFLRYGGTMVNAPGYRFKNMIGPRDKRPPYTGHWNRYSTNGFGIEEFLQFCEMAGFEAAFAINIEESPQDAADMVEYLKGDVSTKWGRQRASNGHPKPYKIKYIEIGNEEVIFHGDIKAEYEHYAERFNLLRSAMHGKDPSMRFICSAWWRPQSPNMELVFKAIDGKADYWDLHTDADEPNSGIKVDSLLTQMKKLFTKWNPESKLKCSIFEENGGGHDISRALGHASTLNAVRRHGDFLLTSCAANALQPLGQNDNGWDQGQVFFTPDKVWGMPPFYAQQMASANHLPLNVECNADNPLDVSAGISEDGKQLVLHIVNATKQAITTDIDLAGFENRKNQAIITQLSGPLTAVNTEDKPALITPKSAPISLPGKVNYTLPATSYTIIRFNR